MSGFYPVADIDPHPEPYTCHASRVGESFVKEEITTTHGDIRIYRGHPDEGGKLVQVIPFESCVKGEIAKSTINPSVHMDTTPCHECGGPVYATFTSRKANLCTDCYASKD